MKINYLTHWAKQEIDERTAYKLFALLMFLVGVTLGLLVSAIMLINTWR